MSGDFSCYKVHEHARDVSFWCHVYYEMDARFKTPTNFFICGQSRSGKSHLVRSMLHRLEDLFYPVPTRVIYCYGEYQKEFDEMYNVELIEGFPYDLYALANDSQKLYNRPGRFNDAVFQFIHRIYSHVVLTTAVYFVPYAKPISAW